MAYAAADGRFSIALAGDAMPTRRLSLHQEPDFLALAEIFRSADAGFANLETVVRHQDEGTPTISRGTHMTTPPALLDELLWLGIGLVSSANNHVFDYGEGGLMAMLGHLEAAGLVHAGSGRNLAEARRPAYLETRAGRVALVATTATFKPWHAAAAQRPDSAGRPGVNPFGFEQIHTVDGPAFEALGRIAQGLGLERSQARDRLHFFTESEAGGGGPEELTLFGQRFRKGEDFAGASFARPDDREDNLRWIREARRQADWVVVSLHSHEFSHRSMASARTRADLGEPADFIPDFARAAIDAGADIVVGHGSHMPLGIELHKGRPIFYSLGNFIFQNETVPAFPAEAYGRFGLGPEATPADFLDTRSDNGRKGHAAQRGFWENIVVTCRFGGGELEDVLIHPIEQGFDAPRSQRGRPVLARPEVAARILERLEALCRPYGTALAIENGTGSLVLGR